MSWFKKALNNIYKEIKGIISFQDHIQTNLIIVFLAFYFFIWTLKMAMNNKITISNIYELVFYSENFILVILGLLFNNIYKNETLRNIAKNIIETKTNTDIDGDGKIGKGNNK